MKQAPVIIWQTIGIIVTISAYNSFGVATTKYASATQRAIVDQAKTILIWVTSCWLLNEPWQPWSIIGFLSLASGSLIYNEILVLPWFGFNKYTKKALAAENYVGLSPHAGYDS
jgi:hypothetical protein